MNTIVSAAAIASAAPAFAAPAAATTLPPELIKRFVRMREWYLDFRQRDRAHMDEIDRRFYAATGVTTEQFRELDHDDPRKKELTALLCDKVCNDVPSAADIDREVDELCDERWHVAEAMLECKPQTITDLAWQAEAFLIADLEVLGGSSTLLIRQLFHHIRTLGGVPQPNDPLGVLRLDISDGDDEPRSTEVSSLPATEIITGADPIFAVIERHRKAMTAFNVAAIEQGEAEFPHPSILVCARERWEHEKLGRPWPFGEQEELRLDRVKEIDALCGSHNPDLRRSFRAALAEVKREYRKTFGPIKARYNAASDAEDEARWQLATTAPTTALGVRSLLHYIKQQEDGCAGDFFQDEERAEFYASLSRAATVLENPGASSTVPA